MKYDVAPKILSVDEVEHDTISAYFILSETPSCEEIQNGICDFIIYIEGFLFSDEPIEYKISHKLVYPDTDCDFEGFDSTVEFGNYIDGIPEFLTPESKRIVDNAIFNDSEIWKLIEKIRLGYF